MNLLINAIGRMKPSPERELCEKYIRQCGWNIAIREYESKKKDLTPRMADESAWLLENSTVKNSKCIVLDERGTMMNSEAFATLLRDWQEEGIANIHLLIGGADGHAQQVRSAADKTIAFSPMTWPHMLTRAMLCEQLYRAYSIIQGHPYHRG